jgi:hypothetical protein
MPSNRLPWILKNYRPTGRRNHGRPLTRLLEVCQQGTQLHVSWWWWWWWWWWFMRQLNSSTVFWHHNLKLKGLGCPPMAKLSYSVLRKSIHWFNGSQRVENTEIMMMARADFHPRFRKNRSAGSTVQNERKTEKTGWSHTSTFTPCFAKIDRLVQHFTTEGKHTETHTPTFLPNDSILVGTMAITTD